MVFRVDNDLASANRLHDTLSFAGGDDLPCAPCIAASLWSDPHLVTFDGVVFDFQTSREFVLLDSEDGTVALQPRHQPWRDSTVVSGNSAVAAAVGSHRVGVNLPGTVRVDGDIAEFSSGDPLDLGDGAQIHCAGDTCVIVWPGAEDERPGLDAAVRDGHLNLTPYLPPSLAGAVGGLLGNGNGDVGDDIALRDGEVHSRPIEAATLYGAYADSWRITESESLFDYAEGESTATFTDRTFPSR